MCSPSSGPAHLCEKRCVCVCEREREGRGDWGNVCAMCASVSAPPLSVCPHVLRSGGGVVRANKCVPVRQAHMHQAVCLSRTNANGRKAENAPCAQCSDHRVINAPTTVWHGVSSTGQGGQGGGEGGRTGRTAGLVAVCMGARTALCMYVCVWVLK